MRSGPTGNPEGLDGAVFQGTKQAIVADWPACMQQFCLNCYNFDVFGGKLVSDDALRASWNISVGSSPKGALDCVNAWQIGLREDLKRIDVPALVIHGDADRIALFPRSGKRTPELINGSGLVVIEGGPHSIAWTRSETVN